MRVSNILDPDQSQHFVGPDLGPNCLQRLSADDTSKQRVSVLNNNQAQYWLRLLDRFPLAYDVASGNDIKQCINIANILVFYIFEP